MFVRGAPQRRQSEGKSVVNRAAAILLQRATKPAANEASNAAWPAGVVRIGVPLLLKTVLPRPAVATGAPPGRFVFSIALRRVVRNDTMGPKVTGLRRDVGSFIFLTGRRPIGIQSRLCGARISALGLCRLAFVSLPRDWFVAPAGAEVVFLCLPRAYALGYFLPPLRLPFVASLLRVAQGRLSGAGSFVNLFQLLAKNLWRFEG